MEPTGNIEHIATARRKRDVLKRGVYILPNSFTSASLFLGFYSIVSTLNGKFDHAAWAIMGSALFDGFDGTVARLTRTQSEFGQEYDSLADVVAFGVAPGVLMYMWALEPFGKWGWAAGFLYVAATALRLARFNIQATTVESRFFQGLPSPAAGCAIASTVLLFYEMGNEGSPDKWMPLLVEAVALGLAMVSTLPYVSTKKMGLEGRVPFWVLPLVVLALTLLVQKPEIGLFTLILGYALSGPVLFVLLRRRRSTRTHARATAGHKEPKAS